MPTARASSNKAKIARRVIEVLEFFDDDHREATVMDIVRRYNRPQSSTSELLSSLVELGILYKNPHSRSYQLSPRAALLGATSQPDTVRDGRLIRLMDRLVAQTGLSVALFGKVRLNTQIVTWRSGPRTSASAARGLFGGMQEPLSQGAAGWLLLSTVDERRCDGVIRHLNAEAPDNRKFVHSEMAERVRESRQNGHARGPAGFGSQAEVLAVLLPGQHMEFPIAVGFVYGREDKVNAEGLLQCLGEAITKVLSDVEPGNSSVERLPNAA
jgi:DNA-binding IclR family transcriptional regulator